MSQLTGVMLALSHAPSNIPESAMNRTVFHGGHIWGQCLLCYLCASCFREHTPSHVRELYTSLFAPAVLHIAILALAGPVPEQLQVKLSRLVHRDHPLS